MSKIITANKALSADSLEFTETKNALVSGIISAGEKRT